MLVSCVAYEQGRKIADIPVADVSEYVRRPDCFVWVALFEPTQAELDEIADEFGLHELAVEDARKGHQRPKIEEYGDSLFAVLHPVELVKLEDGTDDLRIGEVSVFVGTNYVLTVRHRTQLGFAAVRARTEREPELLRHGTQEYFRDVYDHLARINGTIESIRETLTTAIQVNLALIGISDNEVTKRLAAWGALITVPTLIAGIYGM